MSRLLYEKTAIITGSNRGIGNAILRKFAENGANIIACARKKNDVFEANIADISKECGVSIWPLYFDFSNDREIKGAVNTIRSLERKIDIVVNNAGILSEYNRYEMIPIEESKKIFDIDFFSQMIFNQMVIRLMRRDKVSDRSIVFISSIAAQDAFFSSYDYAACKSAINTSVIQMARELGEIGIRVNAISPGVIETDMIADVDSKSKAELLPSIFLRRYGTAEDVANAVAFISSEMASYITGQVIRVDGGITPPRAMW